MKREVFRLWLRSRRAAFVLFFLCVSVFAAVFALYRLPLSAVFYPAGICALIGICFAVADFRKEKERREILSSVSDLTADAVRELPEPQTPGEAELIRILTDLCRGRENEAQKSAARYRDAVDYYTTWAHQIKTPIASMELALQREDTPSARRLRSDLFRIGQYADMVLTFLRLEDSVGNTAGDYVFGACDLDALTRAAVRKFAPEFIDRKIRLEYGEISGTAVTDEKWLSFVLEQILSNALKYTREGSVRIEMRAPQMLVISDTGIGIAPEDLPRIFDRGYTGINGRTDRRASGIGLYLCRRICQRLGVEISVESEVGKGTAVTLDLSSTRQIVE